MKIIDIIQYIMATFIISFFLINIASADSHFSHISDAQLLDIKKKIDNYKLHSLTLTPIMIADNAKYEEVKNALEMELEKVGIDIRLFYLAHLKRNKFQKSISVSQIVDINSNPIEAINGYKIVPKDLSIFHRIGTGNFNNQKIISADGKSEFIIQPYGSIYRMVTNDVNQGTYNFYPPGEKRAHFISLFIIVLSFSNLAYTSFFTSWTESTIHLFLKLSPF